jgi:hypothetical protein
MWGSVSVKTEKNRAHESETRHLEPRKKQGHTGRINPEPFSVTLLTTNNEPGALLFPRLDVVPHPIVLNLRNLQGADQERRAERSGRR